MISWYAQMKHARKPTLVATGTEQITSLGKVALKVGLTHAGRGLLNRAKQLRLTSLVSVTPTGKTAVTRTGSFTLKC